MVTFRKSKKLGPFRVTLSPRGVSTSAGVPGLRVSANSRGEVRRTVGVPGTGIYDTKKLGGSGGGHAQASAESSRAHVTYVEAGTRDLREGQPGVETAKVVGLSETVWELAAFAGLAPLEYGGIHGIRDAILMPDEDRYAVVMLVLPEDNPAIFGRKETEPKGVPIGRLSATDARKWAEAFRGRNIRAVVYLEAKPGTNGTAQFRFRPEALDEEDEPTTETTPLPDAGWFPDPEGGRGPAMVGRHAVDGAQTHGVDGYPMNIRPRGCAHPRCPRRLGSGRGFQGRPRADFALGTDLGLRPVLWMATPPAGSSG